MNKEELEFVEQSNLIEGIRFPSVCYKQDRSCIPEIDNHKKAFEYMKEHCKEPLTEKHILTMHGILMNGLLDSNNAGFYRTCNVRIGMHYGYYPVQIKPAMKKLIKQVKRAKTPDACWNVHHEFEVIHPFVDGNGRIGRLILTWLLLGNGLQMETIHADKRWDYYNKINDYRAIKEMIIYEKEMNK